MAQLWTAVRGRPRETGAVSIGVVSLLGIGAFLVTPGHLAPEYPAAMVREGAFADAVVETGTVDAARLMLYAAPTGAAQSKIVALVAEGTSVGPGDELIRFDDSVLRQSLDKEQAALRQAEAARLRAREDLRVEQLRMEADLEAATLTVTFAERALTNEMEGGGRLAVAEAESAAAEAARELERAKTALEDTRALLPEGFVTRLEVDRADQAYRRAAEQLTLARLKAETLSRYERPRAIDRSMADVNAARSELSRAGEIGASRLAQRHAALEAADSEVAGIEARIALLTEQAARTVVRAEGPGLVVYRELYFGNDRRKPQVGDEVWPNQPLIALPDSSQLVVETRVREIDLHKVAASQRVRVTFDAYPGLTLPASVALVGALAQDDAARAGTKFFPVTVRLLQTDQRLRTGMTAQVEIEVDSSPRARLVPLEAVFGPPGHAYVVVLSGGTPERRRVVVTGTNALEASIGSGLSVGEQVLLVDPTVPRAAAPGGEAR